MTEAHAIAVDAEHRLIHAVPRLAGAIVHANPEGVQEQYHAILAPHKH